MRRLVTLLLASALAAPAGVAAQVCLGYPAGRGEANAGAVVRLRTGLVQLGGTVAGHTPSDVVLEAGVTYDDYTGGARRGFTLAGRGGFELHWLDLPPTLSLCPFAGASIAHAHDLSIVEAPLGLAIGTVLPLDASPPDTGGGAPAGVRSLLLHAAPILFLSHTSQPGHTVSVAEGGLELGARFIYNHLYAGAAILVRSGGNNAVLSLFAGVPLLHRGP